MGEIYNYNWPNLIIHALSGAIPSSHHPFYSSSSFPNSLSKLCQYACSFASRLCTLIRASYCRNLWSASSMLPSTIPDI